MQPQVEVIQSILFNLEEGSLTVIGDVQPVEIFHRTWMIEGVYIINVNDTIEPIKKYMKPVLVQHSNFQKKKKSLNKIEKPVR